MKELQEHGFIINKSLAIVFLWRNAKGSPMEYASDNIIQFGYQPHEFTSCRIPFVSIVHPDDLDRVAAEVAQYSREGRRSSHRSTGYLPPPVRCARLMTGRGEG